MPSRFPDTRSRDNMSKADGPRKLVLCFDGTGNEFTGSNEDTNVVKILSKLDRNAPDQYHYYQTGIGTYDINDESVNKSTLGGIRSSVSKVIDQGFGTTFDAHVIAGYRFLMRYYESGDKIYMFGFSRGAFTAKFLARMINTVGLLCKGNEEMVPFAYKVYQRYLASGIKDKEIKPNTDDKNKVSTKTPTIHAHTPAPHLEQDEEPLHDCSTSGDDDQAEHEIAFNEVKAFRDTFCRKEQTIDDHGNLLESDIKIYFLGIWDCVSSVAVLEQKAPVPVPVIGTAVHVRHAVAVDERRVKFKAALLAQDIREIEGSENNEDVKEVWFPGCHGDVGGGWPTVEGNDFDSGKEVSWWQRVKNAWWTRHGEPKKRAQNLHRLQMSDVPLAWMIHEIKLLDESDPTAALTWRKDVVQDFERHFSRLKEKAMRGIIHDSLTFGCGTSFFKVLLWKFMEWLPLISRWELEGTKWNNVRFPLNKGNTRDIPRDAVLHESVLWRLENIKGYCPTNNHGGHLAPCLIIGKSREEEYRQIKADTGDHQTYHFIKHAIELENQPTPA